MLPELEPQAAVPRILVVEDEVLIRAVLAEELRAAGFRVIETARADEALSYLDAGGEAELVFSDIWMPGPFNGVELARQIRDKYPSLPIILASGNPGPSAVVEPDLFIRKPYDVGRAIAMVFTMLGYEPPREVE